MIYPKSTNPYKEALRMKGRDKGAERMFDENGGYPALACAIVKQAVDDYKYAEAYMKGERNVKSVSWSNRYAHNAELTMAEVVRFFKGRWYSNICDIPGEVMLKYLGVKA